MNMCVHTCVGLCFSDKKPMKMLRCVISKVEMMSLVYYPSRTNTHTHITRLLGSEHVRAHTHTFMTALTLFCSLSLCLASIVTVIRLVNDAVDNIESEGTKGCLLTPLTPLHLFSVFIQYL